MADATKIVRTKRTRSKNKNSDENEIEKCPKRMKKVTFAVSNILYM